MILVIRFINKIEPSIPIDKNISKTALCEPGFSTDFHLGSDTISEEAELKPNPIRQLNIEPFKILDIKIFHTSNLPVNASGSKLLILSIWKIFDKILKSKYVIAKIPTTLIITERLRKLFPLFK